MKIIQNSKDEHCLEDKSLEIKSHLTYKIEFVFSYNIPYMRGRKMGDA